MRLAHVACGLCGITYEQLVAPSHGGQSVNKLAPAARARYLAACAARKLGYGWVDISETLCTGHPSLIRGVGKQRPRLGDAAIELVVHEACKQATREYAPLEFTARERRLANRWRWRGRKAYHDSMTPWTDGIFSDREPIHYEPDKPGSEGWLTWESFPHKAAGKVPRPFSVAGWKQYVQFMRVAGRVTDTEASDRLDCGNPKTMSKYRHHARGYGFEFESETDPSAGSRWPVHQRPRLHWMTREPTHAP